MQYSRHLTPHKLPQTLPSPEFGEGLGSQCPSGISCGDATRISYGDAARKSQRDTLTRTLLACACAYAQAACACAYAVASVGRPLRVRQMPAEGDPPAALVSPPAALSHRGRVPRLEAPGVVRLKNVLHANENCYNSTGINSVVQLTLTWE